MIRRSRRLGAVPHALLAVTLLVFGAAGHLAHHVVDPACDSGRVDSHACSCSALHGAVLHESAFAVAPSSWSRPAEFVAPVAQAPAASIPATCAPRAPPLA